LGGLLLVVLLLGSLTGREGLRGVEICNETELMHQDRMKSAACKATIPKTGGNADRAKTFLCFFEFRSLLEVVQTSEAIPPSSYLVDGFGLKHLQVTCNLVAK
jgi:hypothetical protein